MTPNPEQPMQPQQSWFGRNWKWLVPVGCLVPMMCCGVFGAATYFGVSKVIESSSAFTTAVAKASDNAEVKSAIGTPIKAGFGVNGEIKNNTANFTIPIEGPKGKGSLRVVGIERNGIWNYSVLEVNTGSKTIDLLTDGAQPDEELPAPDDSQNDEPEDPAADPD